jgi:hypothetical protein
MPIEIFPRQESAAMNRRSQLQAGCGTFRATNAQRSFQAGDRLGADVAQQPTRRGRFYPFAGAVRAALTSIRKPLFLRGFLTSIRLTDGASELGMLSRDPGRRLSIHPVHPPILS